MLHPSKGVVIHLNEDQSSNESVGSNVEEVVQWDCSLRSSKTFQTAMLILSGHKFESPNLELLQKVLHNFINQPACDYFRSKSTQATAFRNIQAACKIGWKTEASRKKKWSVHFVAEHLAFLLVLWRQVEKEKETLEANNRSTRSATGISKANNLKRAFRKLWLAYKKPFKLYVHAFMLRGKQRMLFIVRHRCLQLTGPHAQDNIPWGKFHKFESNCPVPKCGHSLTMPLQSWDSIISGDEHLRRAAEADGGDGRFEPLKMKVGVTVSIRTVLEMSLELGAGGVSS
jgi:hypothetical protein